jgi:hypothetical protein
MVDEATKDETIPTDPPAALPQGDGDGGESQDEAPAGDTGE